MGCLDGAWGQPKRPRRNLFPTGVYADDVCRPAGPKRKREDDPDCGPAPHRPRYQSVIVTNDVRLGN